MLGEGEQDVVDLEKLEASMQATLKSLKWDYSNTITARVTPGAAIDGGHFINKSEGMNHEIVLCISSLASLDRVTVDVEGQQVPLRQVGQISMPNSQTLIINMASYPQVLLHLPLMCKITIVITHNHLGSNMLALVITGS